MAKILNGKKISERILKDLKKKIKRNRLKLTLGVVLVGDNKISKIYINQKRKACQGVNISFKLFKFPSKINTLELKKEIKEILPDVSGLIIQLPLSKRIKTQEVLSIIPVEKDVDCLSKRCLGSFYVGESLVLPPMVGAIFQLLKEYKIKIKGKNIVIVGVGKLTGKPLTIWFLQKKATATVINEFTKNTTFFIRNADILFSGAGRPNLINGKMVKEGVVVIDAGTSHKQGRLIGDIDFKSVSKKASYITPVPGGVGPLTVTFVIKNLIDLNA